MPIMNRRPRPTQLLQSGQLPRTRQLFAVRLSRWSWSRGALIGLLALEGCTTSAPHRPIAVVAPPPRVVVAPPPVAPPVAARNRVALLVPLTGANAAVGQSIANAANLALLDTGDSRINLRVYDTAATGAAAAASKAAADGARLFLGPLLAADVRAATAVAAPQGIPIISFSNDAALAGDGVFVMGFQPGQSIARVVAYARGRGVERFAALVPAGVYGQRAATAFLRAVEASGGKTVAVTTYTREPAKLLAAVRTATNFDARKASGSRKAVLRPDGSVVAVAGKLPPVGFQALLIADGPNVAAAIVPGLVQFGVPAGSVMLLGTELWNNEPTVRASRALHGALFASVPDEKFGQLAGRYRGKFGGTPSRLASLGYDAVLLVNSVAGSWPAGQAFPRVLLATPEGYAGIDGAFRFSGNGIAERALEVQQVGSGTVDAAPRTFSR